MEHKSRGERLREDENGMSGETEKDVSAWTIDSLRYHLEQIATDLDKRYQQRFEGQELAVSAAFAAQEKAVDSAFKAQDELLTLQTKMLDERYATQTKAVDAAFLAQQTAMQTALTAAERAVATALLAAEKAVTKAELAAEKRFEAVNEFRGQLADQATTFMPRNESETRMAALAERTDASTGRNAERIAELETRLNVQAGIVTGGNTQRNDSRLNMGAAVGIIGLIISALVIMVTLTVALQG